MKTTRKTHKRLFALLLALTALLSVLVLPVSAKESGGFRYYLTEGYDDDDPYFAVITGHPAAVNGTLTVPATLGGHTVDAIAAAAFSGRKDIKKLVLPDNNITVCEQAFADCTNLRKVTLGRCYVCENAFTGCKSLTSVVVTTTRSSGFDPVYSWNDDGNEALLDAAQTWTRYKNTEYAEDVELNTYTGKRLKLQADHTLRNGESYHWYSADGYAFDPDAYWNDCTGDTVRGKVCWPDTETVVCEVTDKKGDVVWSQSFILNARPTLAYKTRNAITESYLYGVTEYTINHFRWKMYDCLERLGIDPYCG